ncbi:MAG: hypothetical protein ACOCP8_06650 [archaeon]
MAENDKVEKNDFYIEKVPEGYRLHNNFVVVMDKDEFEKRRQQVKNQVKTCKKKLKELDNKEEVKRIKEKYQKERENTQKKIENYDEIYNQELKQMEKDLEHYKNNKEQGLIELQNYLNELDKLEKMKINQAENNIENEKQVFQNELKQHEFVKQKYDEVAKQR